MRKLARLRNSKKKKPKTKNKRQRRVQRMLEKLQKCLLSKRMNLQRE